MRRSALFCFVLVALTVQVLASDALAGESVLLEAMGEELDRSMENLKGKEYARLYYLQYQVTDVTTYSVSASYGAVQAEDADKDRFLDVAVRVGDYSMDNTHELRGGGGFRFYMPREIRIPLSDDPDAIKNSLWLATDRAFKDAQERYIRVKSDRAVKVAEEDPSPDFSKEKSHVYVSDHPHVSFDSAPWKATLKRVSARFKDYPFILTSRASINVKSETKYTVDSEGAKLQFGRNFIRVSLFGETKADDGMRLYRTRSYHAIDLEEVVSTELLIAAVDSIAEELDKLRKAPLVEPYIGPAILMSKASGVFFHEIFGHRIEGHRQKSEMSGQTFTKKVGKKVLPDFISVYDDPSLKRFKGKPLRGYYPYDDEGVPSQRVVVVENGVLKNFLMSRSPIRGFPKSNGHGRKQHGRKVVSRQGNLIVKSSKKVSFPELRAQLVEECKRQGKPYGLIFEDISGGFTSTGRRGPQAFKVLPLLVYRVYADGRPDEVVRGVDVVGTPLTCFAKIIGAADDDDIFNGTCGAESGWVPVSAISPSILVSEIEVEKKVKEQDKPPVLAAPDSKAVSKISEDPLMKAMNDELKRSKKKLKMKKLETPYYIEYTVKDVASIEIEGSFGAITSSNEDRRRNLYVDLRVGGYEFDNTNYVSGSYRSSFGSPRRLIIDDDYNALRRQLWLATDNAYKSALETISQKRAYVKTKTFEEMPDDMSHVKAYSSVEPRAELTASKKVWDERVARISSLFKKHPAIRESKVRFFAVVSNQYFLNSEGSKHLRPGVLYGVEITATAQAKDGMEVSDFITFYSRSEKGLAPLSEIETKTREMASSLTKKAEASTVEDYLGPVLFTGQASAEFFGQLLGENIANPRAPLAENEMFLGLVPGGKLAGKFGRKVLPEFIDITDDPKLRTWKGKELMGSYSVDDDGVAAERVQVVDDGKLTGLLMSRRPTKKVQKSNGHGRAEQGNAVGRMGNMVVKSDKTMSTSELMEEFKNMCKGFDLEYGLIVEKMPEPKFAKENEMQMSYFFGQGQKSPGLLPDPVTVYKVDLKTGKKELIRGCEFSGVTLRMMRDIVGTGDEEYVHSFLSVLTPFGSGIPTSVVSPSILVEEVELRKVSGETPKPPILPNPYFD